MLRNWVCLVDTESVVSTPSRKEDVAEEIEREYRLFGCELICCAGVLLRHSVFVLNLAMNLFHRFYFTTSLRSLDVWEVAMSALIVASKVQEAPRRLHHVLLTFARMRGAYLQDEGAAVSRLEASREELVQTSYKHERELLKQIGYTTYVENPHHFVIPFCRVLFHGLEEATLHELQQMAWNYVNDSFRTSVSCRFTAPAIAASAVYLASMRAGVFLPRDIPWVTALGTTVQELHDITTEILTLYATSAPPKYSKPLTPYAEHVEKQARRDLKKRQREEEEARKQEKKRAKKSDSAKERPRANRNRGSPKQATRRVLSNSASGSTKYPSKSSSQGGSARNAASARAGGSTRAAAPPSTATRARSRSPPPYSSHGTSNRSAAPAGASRNATAGGKQSSSNQKSTRRDRRTTRGSRSRSRGRSRSVERGERHGTSGNDAKRSRGYRGDVRSPSRRHSRKRERSRDERASSAHTHTNHRSRDWKAASASSGKQSGGGKQAPRSQRDDRYGGTSRPKHASYRRGRSRSGSRSRDDRGNYSSRK